MYRLAIFLLVAFCLAMLAEIVAVVAWRDYQRHGDFSLSRSLRSLGSGGPEPSLSSAQAVIPSQVAAPAQAAATPQPALVPGNLSELRSELLYLINSERALARLSPLSLGFSAAAQQHAESMMAYGYRSHWDVHGLTAQMRYTLAGGTNRAQLNIAGPVPLPANGSMGPEEWRAVVRQIHHGFMSLPEELANVLDPWHRQVSLGIACDDSRCWVVQQFETDHLEFNAFPTITGARLALAGEFRGDLQLDALAVWYHAHPRRLSLGQLDATHRYGYGQKPATFLRPPMPPDRYYPNSLVGYEWDTGIDPYTLAAGLPRSSAPPLAVAVAQSAAVPWTTADHWIQDGPSFTVHADLSEAIGRHGAGVYTVQIWGSTGNERVPLTNYAIFVP